MNSSTHHRVPRTIFADNKDAAAAAAAAAPNREVAARYVANSVGAYAAVLRERAKAGPGPDRTAALLEAWEWLERVVQLRPTTAPGLTAAAVVSFIEVVADTLRNEDPAGFAALRAEIGRELVSWHTLAHRPRARAPASLPSRPAASWPTQLQAGRHPALCGLLVRVALPGHRGCAGSGYHLSGRGAGSAPPAATLAAAG